MALTWGIWIIVAELAIIIIFSLFGANDDDIDFY